MTILDVTNNSLRAKAKNIKINIVDSIADDLYSIEIVDDGIGMDEETLKEVTNPFMTSRKTRKVGLGVPFFKELANLDGEFEITSELGRGTRIYTSFRRSHIDKPPLGDIVSTIITLINADNQVDFEINYKLDNKVIEFATKEVKGILEGVSINTPEILIWLKNYLDDLFKNVSKS